MLQGYRKYLSILLILVVLLFWEGLGYLNGSLELFISSPRNVAFYIIENPQRLLKDFFTTGIESVLGLLFAFVLAFTFFLVGKFIPILYDTFHPIIIAFQVVPLVTLAPFFLILFGVGLESKVAMAALISFFPIYLSLVAGFRNMPREFLDLLNVLNASKKNMIKALLPLTYPSLFSGIRVASTLAIIGAIVSEFTGAREGLGKNLFVSALQLEPELLMSSLFLSAFLGHLLFFLINRLERKFGFWYHHNSGFKYE